MSLKSCSIIKISICSWRSTVCSSCCQTPTSLWMACRCLSSFHCSSKTTVSSWLPFILNDWWRMLGIVYASLLGTLPSSRQHWQIFRCPFNTYSKLTSKSHSGDYTHIFWIDLLSKPYKILIVVYPPHRLFQDEHYLLILLSYLYRWHKMIDGFLVISYYCRVPNKLGYS